MIKENWGLGIGDWGLAQSPIPNPQSPIDTEKFKFNLLINYYKSLKIFVNLIK